MRTSSHRAETVAVAAVTSLGLLLWLCHRRGSLIATRAAWWLEQRLLRLRLVEHDTVDVGRIKHVAGVDISFIKGSETDAAAALVVLDVDTLEMVHSSIRRIVLRAPYIPGYLAFREVDFLLELIDELRRDAPSRIPDVILVDGNGILHPNRFGLACHLGVLARIPTIGIGKSLHHVDGLTKDMVRDLTGSALHARGEHVNLVGASGAIWGALLRTTDPNDGQCKPVVVSVGHGLSLPSALELVRRCTRHRIPEPVRQADLQSRAWLREHGAVAGGS